MVRLGWYADVELFFFRSLRIISYGWAGAFWYGQGTRWLASQVLSFYFHLLGGVWRRFGRSLSLMFPSGWTVPVKGFIGR